MRNQWLQYWVQLFWGLWCNKRGTSSVSSLFWFCFDVSTKPEELTNVLEICNIVFTSMFTLEMILKLTAFGFFEYLRNPYNIFDGIIVIIRCVIWVADWEYCMFLITLVWIMCAYRMRIFYLHVCNIECCFLKTNLASYLIFSYLFPLISLDSY